MTEQQIIETLATKVMGWKQIPPRPSGTPEVFPVFYLPVHGDIKDGCIVASKDENGVIDTAHWNPLQNIADAIQLAETVFGEEWTLHKHDGGYTFKGVTPLGKVGNAYHEETKEMAVCNAAMQTLNVGCNFLGECVCCEEETELMPIEEGALGICQDCSTLCEP